MGAVTKFPFTQELADFICEALANGESLRTICLPAEMPSVATVCRWLGEKPTFADQYARAREAQADTLADEILDISDNGVNDWIEKFGAEGQSTGWEYNGDAVQRSRLRVDSRKWYASKLAPKKYGDKIDIEHSGTVNLHSALTQAK